MDCDILDFLLGSDRLEGPKDCNLIKKRHTKLSADGDLCFPLDKAAWGKFLNERPGSVLDFDKEELITRSAEWKMPIQRVDIDGGTCRLYLNRTVSFRRVFQSEAGEQCQQTPIDLSTEAPTDIQMYRKELAMTILKRLLSIHNRSSAESSQPEQTFSIAPCMDPDTRKPSKLSYADYLQKRSTDMQLIAQHKYGLRAQSEKVLVELTKRLGKAAVIVDLMEVKASAPVILMSRNHSVPASSRGASFILYNSARIETLFRLYEERLTTGYYPAEPDETDTDWSVLKEEDEWMLFFNYLVEYGSVVERIHKGYQNGEVQIHFLCSFLYKLVGHFSVYYRRTKILTVGRIWY